MADFLRIHSWVPFSQANGPGCRAVIWVQGCTLKCPGCYNPETHPQEAGQLIRPEILFRKIARLEGKIEGVTISGGEPLQQIKPLIKILQLFREKTRLSVILFTGYTWSEVTEMKESSILFPLVDVIIAGRYQDNQRLAKSLQGSANKTFHFLTERYKQEDFQKVPEAEVLITPEGKIISTGIDPFFLSGGFNGKKR